MKYGKTILKKNKKGSTLVLVVGICSILLIFLTTSLSVAQLARQQTYIQYNKKQAYYSANSAVNLFASNISSDSDLKQLISNMSPGSSYTTVEKIKLEGLGEIEYTIKKTTSGSVIVTAKAYYNNAVSESSVILTGNGKNSNVPTFDAAAVSLESAGFSNNFTATGDIVAQTGTKIQTTNDGKIYGNIYVAGDLELNSASKIIQGESKEEFSIVATKSIYITNKVEINYSAEVNKAFINCDAFKVSTDGLTIGNRDKKLDIYCNNLNLDGSTSSSPTKYNANVYVYKKDGTASPSVRINSGDIYGDVYIDGNVGGIYSDGLMKGTIHGDLIVTGILDTSSAYDGFKVKGDVYCDKLQAKSDRFYVEGLVHCRAIEGDQSGRYTRVWNSGDDAKISSIPNRPDIPNPTDVFAPYQATAESYISQATLDEINNGPNYDLNITSEINESGRITNSAPAGKTITIKVGNKPIWLEIGVQQFYKVKFIIEKSSTSKTPVYFIVPENQEVQFAGSQVITTETQNKINSNSTFYVGNRDNVSNTITKGQEIYWLLCKNSKLNITGNDNLYSMIEGYVYGPQASINCDNRGKFEAYYSVDGLSSNDNKMYPHIIGAVVVKDAKMSNTGGILYLVPRSEGLGSGVTGGGGGEISSWKVEKFVKK